MMTDSRSERGFTLIELMVVILIIGILIAIALPTFLGARTRAQDRAAQSEIRTALVSGLAWYAQGESYANFDAGCAAVPGSCTNAEAMDPAIEWVGAGAPLTSYMAIHVATATELLLVRRSQSGTYWCVGQILGNPVTLRGGDATFANVDTVAECTQGWT